MKQALDAVIVEDAAALRETQALILAQPTRCLEGGVAGDVHRVWHIECAIAGGAGVIPHGS